MKTITIQVPSNKLEKAIKHIKKFSGIKIKAEKVIKRHNLTPRQNQILKFLLQGLSNDGIANELNISKRTVDAHRQTLLHKTQSKNMMGLVRYAQVHGLFK